MVDSGEEAVAVEWVGVCSGGVGDVEGAGAQFDGESPERAVVGVFGWGQEVECLSDAGAPVRCFA